MPTQAKKPVMQRLTCLLLTLVFVLTGASVGFAGQMRWNSTSSQKLTVTKPLRLAQTYNRYGSTGQTGRKYPGKPSGNRGNGHRGGGGGIDAGTAIGIGIGILGAIDAANQANRPPKKVYRKPKRRYVKKPRPVKTARPAPRRPSGPAVIQPIPQFLPDQVTVLIQDQPDSVDNQLAQAFGLTVISSSAVELLDGRIVTFRIPQGRPISQAIASLTADPRVALAQPNNVYLTVQQRARAAKATAQYALAKLGLEPAHKLAQGRGVPVAVIDTGIDLSHPVLSRSVSQTYDAVADGKPNAQDHGTAIAGLITGHGKVQGVAPAANLMAVRAFYMHKEYNRPVTSSAILIRAFDWAYANDARVFNMSFSGPYDPLVHAALTAAYNKGVILVAAAGNGGPKAPPAYPAAYKNVIAITALDQKDKLYAHANRGGYLTAAAPGVDVLVPSLKKGYKFSSGTSMAAAHVSGLVALLLEKNPEATSQEILDTITRTAHDLGPKGHDVQFGAGRADAYASLQSLPSNASEVKLTSGQ